MSHIVRLPWPPSIAWPNRTKNRFVRQKGRKQTRDAGKLCAFRSGLILPDGKLLAVVRFHPPRLGRWDIDNALAACKGYFDGVFEVCGRDDADIDAALPIRCCKVPSGVVVMEFRPMAVVSDWLRERPSLLLD